MSESSSQIRLEAEAAVRKLDGEIDFDRIIHNIKTADMEDARVLLRSAVTAGYIQGKIDCFDQMRSSTKGVAYGK